MFICAGGGTLYTPGPVVYSGLVPPSSLTEDFSMTAALVSAEAMDPVSTASKAAKRFFLFFFRVL